MLRVLHGGAFKKTIAESSILQNSVRHQYLSPLPLQIVFTEYRVQDTSRSAPQVHHCPAPEAVQDAAAEAAVVPAPLVGLILPSPALNLLTVG